MRSYGNSCPFIFSILITILLALFCYRIQSKYTLWDLYAGVLVFCSPYYISSRMRVFIWLLGIFLTIGLLALIVDIIIRCFTRNERNYHYVKSGKISLEEYERQTSRVTREKLEELRESEEYKKMLAEKGNDISNWNWQTAQRQERERYYHENGQYPEESEEESEIEDEDGE